MTRTTKTALVKAVVEEENLKVESFKTSVKSKKESKRMFDTRYMTFTEIEIPILAPEDSLTLTLQDKKSKSALIDIQSVAIKEVFIWSEPSFFEKLSAKNQGFIAEKYISYIWAKRTSPEAVQIISKELMAFIRRNISKESQTDKMLSSFFVSEANQDKFKNVAPALVLLFICSSLKRQQDVPKWFDSQPTYILIIIEEFLGKIATIDEESAQFYNVCLGTLKRYLSKNFNSGGNLIQALVENQSLSVYKELLKELKDFKECLEKTKEEESKKSLTNSDSKRLERSKSIKEKETDDLNGPLHRNWEQLFGKKFSKTHYGTLVNNFIAEAELKGKIQYDDLHPLKRKIYKMDLSQVLKLFPLFEPAEQEFFIGFIESKWKPSAKVHVRAIAERKLEKEVGRKLFSTLFSEELKKMKTWQQKLLYLVRLHPYFEEFGVLYAKGLPNELKQVILQMITDPASINPEENQHLNLLVSLYFPGENNYAVFKEHYVDFWNSAKIRINFVNVLRLFQTLLGVYKQNQHHLFMHFRPLFMNQIVHDEFPVQAYILLNEFARVKETEKAYEESAFILLSVIVFKDENFSRNYEGVFTLDRLSQTAKLMKGMKLMPPVFLLEYLTVLFKVVLKNSPLPDYYAKWFLGEFLQDRMSFAMKSYSVDEKEEAFYGASKFQEATEKITWLVSRKNSKKEEEEKPKEEEKQMSEDEKLKEIERLKEDVEYLSSRNQQLVIELNKALNENTSFKEEEMSRSAKKRKEVEELTANEDKQPIFFTISGVQPDRENNKYKVTLKIKKNCSNYVNRIRVKVWKDLKEEIMEREIEKMSEEELTLEFECEAPKSLNGQPVRIDAKGSYEEEEKCDCLVFLPGFL